MPDFSQAFILTDLDGTLLNSHTEISPENAAAARYFIRHGGRFTFATGRSLPGARQFVADIPVNAPAVLNNGSYGYDFAASRAAYAWPVVHGAALALTDAVLAAFPDCGIEVFTEDGPWVVSRNAWTDRHVAYIKIPMRQSAMTAIPEPWVSMGLLIDPARMPQVVAFVRQHFAGDFFIQQSMGHFLEIQSPIANKGAGILEICRQLGVPPAHLYTVGDGTNDIELLSVTPNAFAPQNACPEVLALGPTLLPHHDEHILPALIAHIEARLGAAQTV